MTGKSKENYNRNYINYVNSFNPQIGRAHV